MRGTIKIGSKMVELLANGATPIRYKQLFKKDLLRILIQNSETDKERRKLLDDAAAEFRGKHTPEEAKRLIEERKQQIDEEIRQQEEITGQHIELSDVKRYANAVDSLAQDLIPQEQLDAFEEKCTRPMRRPHSWRISWHLRPPRKYRATWRRSAWTHIMSGSRHSSRTRSKRRPTRS